MQLSHTPVNPYLPSPDGAFQTSTLLLFVVQASLRKEGTKCGS